MIKLEKYDYNKNLIWGKTLTKDYYLSGGNLSVETNGDIFISAYSKSSYNNLPYNQTITDSIYLFHLNSAGNIIHQYSFYIGANNAFPIELYNDNSGTLIFYQKNNIIYYRKISSSTLSPEYNSQLTYYNVESRSKYCFNKSSSKALLFANNNGVTRLIQLDKNTLTTNNLAILPSSLRTINYVHDIDSNHVILCGKSNNNKESIGHYNTAIQDTIWTKVLSVNSNSQVLKCVTDNQKNFIYLISNNSNNIIVRKLLFSNGAESWAYTFNGTANLNDSPIDVIYDNQRGHVIVSGFETTSLNNTKALILVIDSLGNLIDTIQKTGDFTGNNYALCSRVLPDGSVWVGGNLNKNTFGLAGFIFEIDSSNIITSVKNFEQPFELGVNISPNPFSSKTTLHVNNSLKNAKLILYNSNGKLVKEINNINGQMVILNRDNLPTGLYLMQLSDDSSLTIKKKIMILD